MGPGLSPAGTGAAAAGGLGEGAGVLDGRRTRRGRRGAGAAERLREGIGGTGSWFGGCICYPGSQFSAGLSAVVLPKPG